MTRAQGRAPALVMSGHKSPDALLELFQNATLARSSNSIETPRKGLGESPVSGDSSLLRQFLMKGTSVSNETVRPRSDDESVLVQFKKSSLDGKTISGGIVAVFQSLLAYVVSERKVRVFNVETGHKVSIDRPQNAICSISWSEGDAGAESSLLGVLAGDGEVTLGRIVADGEVEDDGMVFETVSILSFPEIGRARRLSWSTGTARRHLAVFGHTSEVFFVHFGAGSLSPKTSFVSTSVDDICNVAIVGETCFVVGKASVEVFRFANGCFHQSDLIVFDDAFDTVQALHDPNAASGECVLVAPSAANGVLNVFFHNEGGNEKIASLQLTDGRCRRFSDVKYDVVTRTVILFSRGERGVCVIGMQDPKHPYIVNVSEQIECNAAILDLVVDSRGCRQRDGVMEVGLIVYCAEAIKTVALSYQIVEHAEEEEVGMSMEEGPTEEADDGGSSIDVANLEAFRREIRETVVECVKESLTEAIYVALNRSIQEGFRQVSEDLAKMMQNMLQLDAPSKESLSPSQDSSALPSSGEQSVRELVAQKQLGKALVKACGLDNESLLLEVCRCIDDPFSVLDEEQMSQRMLASLFGLLSGSIDEETELRLDWLQEVLIQIDLDEGVIESPELPEQVDSLFMRLQTLVYDAGTDGNLQKKIKTVMRLLRKFQMN